MGAIRRVFRPGSKFEVMLLSLIHIWQLLETLWDIDERFVDEHTLTTSISRIRSKIESDGGAPYIKTVYGMGYQWTGGEAK